jgi:hypothetical protein
VQDGAGPQQPANGRLITGVGTVSIIVLAHSRRHHRAYTIVNPNRGKTSSHNAAEADVRPKGSDV